MHREMLYQSNHNSVKGVLTLSENRVHLQFRKQKNTILEFLPVNGINLIIFLLDSNVIYHPTTYFIP